MSETTNNTLFDVKDLTPGSESVEGIWKTKSNKAFCVTDAGMYVTTLRPRSGWLFHIPFEAVTSFKLGHTHNVYEPDYGDAVFSAIIGGMVFAITLLLWTIDAGSEAVGVSAAVALLFFGVASWEVMKEIEKEDSTRLTKLTIWYGDGQKYKVTVDGNHGEDIVSELIEHTR